MTMGICPDCHHALSLHDVWGICMVGQCKPCHDELACPRCAHKFIDHVISNREVMCAMNACTYLVCYDQNQPDKPRSKLPAVEREPVLPLPPAGEQTTMFPTVPMRMQEPYKPQPPRPVVVEKRWMA